MWCWTLPPDSPGSPTHLASPTEQGMYYCIPIIDTYNVRFTGLPLGQPKPKAITCGVEHSLLIPPVSRLVLPHQQSKVCVIAYRSSTPITFALQGSLWGNQFQKRSLPSDSPDSLWPCPASLLVLLVYSYSSMSYVPPGPLWGAFGFRQGFKVGEHFSSMQLIW